MTDRQIEDAVKRDIDIVLPMPLFARHVMATSNAFGVASVITDAISDICPDYLGSVKKYFSNKIFFPSNLVFAKRSVFCQYYDWMFRILDECRKIFERNQWAVGLRMWGYYGEHLTNIFFIRHMGEYKAAHAKMEYMT